MIVKLKPTEVTQAILAELVQGRKILYIACEPSQMDMLKHNGNKTKNLKPSNIRIECVNNGKTYDSISQAARALGLDPGAISRIINSKQESTQGFRFVRNIKETK